MIWDITEAVQNGNSAAFTGKEKLKTVEMHLEKITERNSNSVSGNWCSLVKIDSYDNI